MINSDRHKVITIAHMTLRFRRVKNIISAVSFFDRKCAKKGDFCIFVYVRHLFFNQFCDFFLYDLIVFKKYANRLCIPLTITKTFIVKSIATPIASTLV
jgi:hypothetical protein